MGNAMVVTIKSEINGFSSFVPLGFHVNDEHEGETKDQIAKVAEEVVEVKKVAGVEERNLASGVVEADIVVPGLQLHRLGLVGGLENVDSVEDADDEQDHHVELVLLILGPGLVRRRQRQ